MKQLRQQKFLNKSRDTSLTKHLFLGQTNLNDYFLNFSTYMRQKETRNFARFKIIRSVVNSCRKSLGV